MLKSRWTVKLLSDSLTTSNKDIILRKTTDLVEISVKLGEAKLSIIIYQILTQIWDGIYIISRSKFGQKLFQWRFAILIA